MAKWQTRYVQVVVGVTPWEFKSPLRHQEKTGLMGPVFLFPSTSSPKAIRIDALPDLPHVVTTDTTNARMLIRVANAAVILLTRRSFSAYISIRNLASTTE